MESKVDKSEENNQKDDVHQFLTFVLSDETYGIGILHIKEIIEYGNLTSVPMMPDFIAGVINLRGSVVPVVSLSHRFQLEPAAIGKKTSIIVIEIKSEGEVLEVGVIVDMVNEVLELKPDELSPAPSFGTKIRADFIKHMGKRDDDTFMILLDVDSVLSVDELSVIQEVNATGEKDLISKEAKSSSK